eukprot:scaffold4247_cov66-Cylindrotheca_fusiformis.AAC.5
MDSSATSEYLSARTFGGVQDGLMLFSIYCDISKFLPLRLVERAMGKDWSTSSYQQSRLPDLPYWGSGPWDYAVRPQTHLHPRPHDMSLSIDHLLYCYNISLVMTTSGIYAVDRLTVARQ